MMLSNNGFGPNHSCNTHDCISEFESIDHAQKQKTLLFEQGFFVRMMQC